MYSLVFFEGIFITFCNIGVVRGNGISIDEGDLGTLVIAAAFLRRNVTQVLCPGDGPCRSLHAFRVTANEDLIILTKMMNTMKI